MKRGAKTMSEAMSTAQARKAQKEAGRAAAKTVALPTPPAPAAANPGDGFWKLAEPYLVDVEITSGQAQADETAFLDLVEAIARVAHLPPGLAGERQALPSFVRRLVTEALRVKRRTAESTSGVTYTPAVTP